MSDKVKPYDAAGSKKEQVEQMFDNIAHRYDFLNRFLSFGIDRIWRRKAIRILKKYQPERILDVASGTGDFALEALSLKPKEIIGIDLSEHMLEIGRKKLRRLKISNIHLQKADSENLPFEAESFDAVTVAFGVRNFENLSKGLSEMHRVLKAGGAVVILEFSQPRGFFSLLYKIYSKLIVPLWGKIISGDNAAYRYLPESVKAFPEAGDFKAILSNCGYQNVRDRRLTLGICSIYWGEK
jgi:demethylmenaquinone methyltransferase/2-methoxy-6-polyprenyl-1,4-benzoquinol methylase